MKGSKIALGKPNLVNAQYEGTMNDPTIMRTISGVRIRVDPRFLLHFRGKTSQGSN
jgi:hypothetical protein